MIIDYIEHGPQYDGTWPRLAEGMAFLASLKDAEPGRYENGPMFANVMEVETCPREQKSFERHEAYIDVQYIVRGMEVMEWEDVTHLEETVPYDREKDIALLQGAGKRVEISAGMFYLVLPHDAHMPGCCGSQGPAKLKKIVLKLPR